jgi:phage terminase small subunit
MKTPLPHDLELKLNEYRQQRRDEIGRKMFRDAAIVELLRKALEGVAAPNPLSDRVNDLERRLRSVEIEIAETARLEYESMSNLSLMDRRTCIDKKGD